MATIQAPQVESWLYADLPGLNTIRIDEGGGYVTFTSSATDTVSNVLDDWAAQATAWPAFANTYAFTWVPATQQVSLSATGNFDIQLRGGLELALGFRAGMTGASSYLSDAVPQAIANPLNIDYDPPWAAEQTELRSYRWGRIQGRAHFRAYVTRVAFLMLRAQCNELLSGPLFVGKFRIYPCGYTSGKYAADNLRGYLDIFPYEYGESSRIGSGDSHANVNVIGSVDDS